MTLKKCNKVRTLLIEMDATGSQGHVCIQDGDQEVSVTMAAVHGKEGDGEANRTQGCIQSFSGNESRYMYNCCRAIKEALACNEIEIDVKERGL